MPPSIPPCHLERVRGEEMRRLAHELKLTYRPDGDPAVKRGVSRVVRRALGIRRSADFQIRNLLGRQLRLYRLYLFDLVPTPGRGAKWRRATAACVASDALKLPQMSLRPEGFLDTLRALVGQEDIDLAGYPAFSRRYYLKGMQEKRIRLLFNRELVQFFMQHRGLSTDAWGHVLLIHHRGRLAHRGGLTALATSALALFALMTERQKQVPAKWRFTNPRGSRLQRLQDRVKRVSYGLFNTKLPYRRM